MSISENTQSLDTNNQFKLQGIEVLRGLAIILVLIFHCVIAVWSDYQTSWHGFFPNFDQPFMEVGMRMASLGASGVALFFVLSGYCIHLSATRGRFKVGEFCWKRFWRIYPPFLFVLLILAIAREPSLLSFIAHLTFTNNLHETTFMSGSINASFWSLPVEFQLYLLYPILHFWLAKKGSILTLLVVTGGITLLFYTILPFYFSTSLSPLAPKGTPFAYWIFWISGALLCRTHQQGKIQFKKPLLWLALLFPLFIATRFVSPLAQISWWVYCPFFLVLCEVFIRYDWNVSAKLVKIVSYLGTISYSLYMWHQPFFIFVSQKSLGLFGVDVTPASLLVTNIVILVVLIIPVSALTYRWIELGSVNLGKKLFPSAFQRKIRPVV